MEKCPWPIEIGHLKNHNCAKYFFLLNFACIGRTRLRKYDENIITII